MPAADGAGAGNGDAQARHRRQMPASARPRVSAELRVEADRRVDRAEALVAAPFDDLEEEQVLEALGIDLQIFAVGVLVVENVVGLQDFSRSAGRSTRASRSS